MRRWKKEPQPQSTALWIIRFAGRSCGRQSYLFDVSYIPGLGERRQLDACSVGDFLAVFCANDRLRRMGHKVCAIKWNCIQLNGLWERHFFLLPPPSPSLSSCFSALCGPLNWVYLRNFYGQLFLNAKEINSFVRKSLFVNKQQKESCRQFLNENRNRLALPSSINAVYKTLYPYQIKG